MTVTDNFALEELEAASAGDKPLFFLGRNMFQSTWKERKFSAPTTSGVTHVAFEENTDASRVLSGRSCVVALPTGSQLALNRRSLPEGSPNLVMLPCGDTRNVLTFIVSSVGQPATLPENRQAVSFWQLEHDPSFPGRTFSGFGRYALLQVLDPSPIVRVVLDFTISPTQRQQGVYPLPLLPWSVPSAFGSPLSAAAPRASCRLLFAPWSSVGVHTSCSTWEGAVKCRLFADRA